MKYYFKDFVCDFVICNEIRILCGHFTTKYGVVFSIAYGYADRNEDYFEYAKISEEDYSLLKDKYSDMNTCTLEECIILFHKYFSDENILCNSFPCGTRYCKNYFEVI